jgi:hypothetical protein
MIRGLRQTRTSISSGHGANVAPARLAVRVQSSNKGNAGERLARELLDVVQGDQQLRA